jgi:hypothetical protein
MLPTSETLIAAFLMLQVYQPSLGPLAHFLPAHGAWSKVSIIRCSEAFIAPLLLL